MRNGAKSILPPRGIEDEEANKKWSTTIEANKKWNTIGSCSSRLHKK
jgi:hypothetical protein